MIGAGIAVVFKSNINRSAASQPPAARWTRRMANRGQLHRHHGRLQAPHHHAGFGGEITAIMGGCDLDLRQSSINGDAVLNVFVLCGGITIKVPVDWTVVFDGLPIMGGFDEKTVPPTGPGSGKRLIVRGYVIMGGMEVRN
jgi:hypothetical protein